MRRRRRSGGTRPKRIVILSWRDPWHPEGGGSERWLQEVAERLAQRHEVIVLTAAYPGGERQRLFNGVRYIRRGNAHSVFPRADLALALGRYGHVDAVLEVQNGMPFLSRLFTRTRVVVLVHHIHREQWKVVGPLMSKLGWWLESRVSVHVNRDHDHLAVSEVTRSEMATLGVAAENIALAWNGTDEVPELGPEDDEARDPTLVVLSRLVPHKQVEHAVRITAALRPEFPTLHLRIVGSGWWEDQIRAEIVRLGVEDAVTLVGHVDERTKYAELQRAWVHLMPSVKEGWGLSVIEAAQVARPSIAYLSAGGVRDSIVDGVTGLLAHDEAEMTEMTRRLLVDGDLRARLGEAARERATGFTWDATAATVEAQLLPARHRAGVPGPA